MLSSRNIAYLALDQGYNGWTIESRNAEDRIVGFRRVNGSQAQAVGAAMLMAQQIWPDTTLRFEPVLGLVKIAPDGPSDAELEDMYRRELGRAAYDFGHPKEDYI